MFWGKGHGSPNLAALNPSIPNRLMSPDCSTYHLGINQRRSAENSGMRQESVRACKRPSQARALKGSNAALTRSAPCRTQWPLCPRESVGALLKLYASSTASLVQSQLARWRQAASAELPSCTPPRPQGQGGDDPHPPGP